ncbi:MAG TPA: transglycosylase SLT domain-containing protein [Nocardioides sp.]|nr:transglycosylase SLT domain-containing protein [Nocardioides sp.]
MPHETPVRRWLRRATAGTTTAGLLALALPAVTATSGGETGPEPATTAPAARPPAAEAPAAQPPAARAPGLRPVAHHKPHPNRTMKRYRVRPGDTPSGIAVRYHAWTAQLMRLNHTRTLYVGDVIVIPVVTEAARACTRHRHHRTNVGGHARHRPAARAGAGRHRADARPRAARAPHHVRHARHWHHREASRSAVRAAIVRAAQRHGVSPSLALAVAWQEAGWQHDRVSPAGAIGAMQVLPGTGRWMSTMVGRRLNIKDLYDNVTAGVVLLRWLRDEARPRYAVAGYYQGLAGVRRHGMYRSTERYVDNVMALRKRIADGWNPA